MKRPPEPLNPDEVLSLLDACEGLRYEHRERALVALLWRSGLRCSEALNLRRCDIDLKSCSIRVLHGKGDKSRVVGMDSRAMGYLEAWLVIKPDSEWIFATASGAPMRANYVRYLISLLGKRAGITKRVHPHGLRHSLASDMARERLPINIIQAQLGHSDAATTARYIAKIAPQELIETMQNRKWR